MNDDDRQTEAVEVESMQAVDIDRHSHERILGLMSQLGLPELRGIDGVFRKPLIEIEVEPGRWTPIDSLAMDDEKIVFSYGTNGKRQDWTFLRAEGCPRWRRAKTAVVHGLGVGCA